MTGRTQEAPCPFYGSSGASVAILYSITTDKAASIPLSRAINRYAGSIRPTTS